MVDYAPTWAALLLYVPLPQFTLLLLYYDLLPQSLNLSSIEVHVIDNKHQNIAGFGEEKRLTPPCYGYSLTREMAGPRP
ncbi:hypothetical protein BKA63DRAFT_504661 [Paraphoma chrysanthemicola]|nr:hypothetical protein BKA63DRAFT_504661 [Paraphoma chrysanthemicola]